MLAPGHKEGTGDAEDVDSTVLEVDDEITIGDEVRTGDSLSVLDDSVDVNIVEESVDSLAELVSIIADDESGDDVSL